MLATMTSFADITTIAVGGEIDRFVEPTTRVGVIEAVEEADAKGLPLFVIGGGSNVLVSDEPFHGVVVRDARRAITVPDEAAPVEGDDRTVHVNAEAGCNWDDFVDYCVRLGLEGVEGLSGIPGTVGASVVQNIGAYGQDVASSVESVEVWDRKDKAVKNLHADELRFGYRMSALKASMYQAPAVPAGEFFPTPRYVVLSVTFALRHSSTGVVGYGQLAKALGVEVGDRMDTKEIRDAVLRVRAAKGMLEDATRYTRLAMQGTKKATLVATALRAQNDTPDANRHSCGSFFMNPILTAEQAAMLPPEAPRFEAVLPNGEPGVKTSAAWLIDHAGFHKGYTVDDDAKAGLSTLHTLALTNRGQAGSQDVAKLAKTVQDGVEHTFGVRLVPEPVVVGFSLR
ncbi:UDP-N-acetylenolpyruvoylglucosamine reductase domain protein [Bifidobacterium angulatum DSM 20098 = JCM 7096]|uniref:UDP-N-acetylenolpyruvoylglucosamine reductase n=2 Tax=Bifidobacterium angulatum TaxID=1683 RepID=C4FH60_9BIFI|nr:UDP-N-acetylenolpyruvoylglucosamine reductase domain protein [Bifidobacterium angulatum DSM 20098 = JCM 7096]BAQ95884.1 UDP-N-acetylenolpyruvoylglucosamine reductase [Bifidobacterium angulatum DSM 20098 = JCM 7096]